MPKRTYTIDEVNAILTKPKPDVPITGETGMQMDNTAIQVDFDLSKVEVPDISDEELRRRTNIRLATDIIEDRYDPPLSSYMAAIKTSKGSSTKIGTLPNSIIDKFLEEIKPELDKPSDTIDWIIPGLWFRGQLWMLAGDPGVGKTSALLSTLMSISQGNPVFDNSYTPYRPCNVLYLNSDSSKVVFDNSYYNKLRIEQCQNMHIVHMHELMRLSLDKISVPFSFDNINSFKILSKMIKDSNVDILVVDTFGAMLTCDESSSKEVTPIMSKLRGWAAENKILLILVHHFRKRDIRNQGAPRTLEDVSGSKSIYGQCDSVLSVESRFDEFGKKVDKSGIIRVLKEGSSGGLKNFPSIHFDIINDSPDRFHVNFFNDSVEDEDALSVLSNKLLLLLKEGNDTFKKLFCAIQMYQSSSKSTVSRSILELKENGLIKSKGHTRRTYYTITPEGCDKIVKIESEVIVERKEEEDEFDLTHDPHEETKMEIARLREEIAQLEAWDLSPERSLDEIYADAPLDMKKQIDEFHSIDEWTGYEDLRDTYEYRIRRMSTFTTQDQFEHEMLFIANDNNKNNQVADYQISRLKLNQSN